MFISVSTLSLSTSLCRGGSDSIVVMGDSGDAMEDGGRSEGKTVAMGVNVRKPLAKPATKIPLATRGPTFRPEVSINYAKGEKWVMFFSNVLYTSTLSNSYTWSLCHYDHSITMSFSLDRINRCSSVFQYQFSSDGLVV